MTRRHKKGCRCRRHRRGIRSVGVVRGGFRFNALRDCRHPLERDNARVEQEAVQKSDTIQTSDEVIVVRNSCDVKVTTRDTKTAVNMQHSLQYAIATIMSMSIADGNVANEVSQELFQKAFVKQSNHQRTLIENSKGVTVDTTDTDVSVNIQMLSQMLCVLIKKMNL
ncbi:spore coat protein X [Aneurinibacillus soli]|uniref:Spore coat protein X n=1 Tax=Aneurinibacillus soli TaxID=1500254 RepID=A0A0U4WEV8_9BACL|nr:spore coat protein [Aneurinibacillus soli]PYE60359.1 spore coat protein X [Aneurinibacillus soli]BAU27241.1 Spore coat protein X [Aneurinibacillus soli]